MNRIIILSIALIISIRVGAQAPQKMSYQAVIRNNGGNGVANANVGVKISVLQASATGTAVYIEKHTTISDSNGLINLEIGGGTPLTGTFASINWANGPYFLKTETDPKGGTNYTITGTSQLLSVPYALFAASSGTPGPAGTNGLNILNGVSNPSSSTGLDGEFYINTATNTLFGPKAGGTWPSGVSIVGPSGSVGANGSNGLSVLNGTINPGPAIGSNGEFYINTITNTIFGPKAGNVWPSGISVVGPSGAVGASGPNGLSLLNGTINPGSGIGQNGEFYINTLTNTIFGPKAGGNWPSGISLIGPSGAVGSNGLNILNGTVDPIGAIGVNGEFYINTTTNTLFGPKSAGAWPIGKSLIGPAGMLSPGNVAGNTPYWDGTSWVVNNSNIFNAGGNVGVGTSIPVAKLDVMGTMKIKDGSQGVGKVLTSDANGLATWATPGTGGWGLTGTSGTIDGTNFIGTTDDVPLSIKINNEKAGRIDKLSLFLGYKAGNNNNPNYGLENVGVGTQALATNTSGGRNVAIGSNALFSNTQGIENTAIGRMAMFSNTNGLDNTAIGDESLYNNTSGIFNTAVGAQSLYSNTTGRSNTAQGIGALATNTTGSFNTAIGTHADVSSGALTNATAVGNGAQVTTSNTVQLGNSSVTQVFVGVNNYATLISGGLKIVGGSPAIGKVLTSDADGLATWRAPSGWGLTGTSGTVDGTSFIGTTDNVPFNIRVNNEKAGRIEQFGEIVFLGYQAGNSNTAGGSTGIGYQALFSNTTGYLNTAIGALALSANITGADNTASGAGALGSNTIGSSNTANGYLALYASTSGNNNAAIGTQALRYNTTGSSNTASGSDALINNTEGHDNTANGYTTLFNNTTGSNNTASGSDALRTNMGSFNTAAGSKALYSNLTGNYNTALGYFADAIGGLTNATAIGSRAIVTASNMIRLGDNNVTSINGAVDFTVVSDKRFKKDIQENVSGLPFIMKLRPVTYHLDMNKMASFMKTPDNLRAKESEAAKEKVLQTGFIAQEVENAAQELSYDFSGVDKPESDSDYYGLRYAEFTVPLVKAVQEQQKMINDLQLRIQQLEEQSRSKQAALQKAEAENAVLKSDYNSRLKKLEEMVGMKAQK